MDNCLLPFGSSLQELRALLRAQAAIQSPEIDDVAPKRYFDSCYRQCSAVNCLSVQWNLIGGAPAWHTGWVSRLKIAEVSDLTGLPVGRHTSKLFLDLATELPFP